LPSPVFSAPGKGDYVAFQAQLGRSDRFLNIVQRVSGEILRDFSAKPFRQLLVVALAKLTGGARGRDNDKIRNFAIQHPLVEQIGDSGEAVFRGLPIIRIGQTALMDPLFTISISGSAITLNEGLASARLWQNMLNFSPASTARGVPLGSMKFPI
jgi:hypothetical protein